MRKKLHGLTVQWLPEAATLSAAGCPGRSEEFVFQDMHRDGRGWTEKEWGGLCCQGRGICVNKQWYTAILASNSW